MNKYINRRALRLMPLLVVPLLLCLFLAATAAAQESGTTAPVEAEQPGAADKERELVRILRLTPEQIAGIRMIREQNRDARRQATERLRSAQRALDEAIYTDNPSEAVIEERSRELAQAQAAATRLRALTELSIRRVLTPEQLGTLRTLRQSQAQRRLERRLNAPRRQRNRQQQQPDGGDGRPLSPRQRLRLRADDLEQQPGDSRPGARARERRRAALRGRRP